MIYEVIITEQADADLRGIYEYIAFELLSLENAAGQLDRLVLGECREIHRSLVENGKLEGCFAADKWMGYSGAKKHGIDFSLEPELYKTHIGSEFGITEPAMKNMLRCYAICCSGLYI